MGQERKNSWVRSCIKATEFIEKKEVVGLTFLERSQLLFHLSICNSCREYRKQSKLIEEAVESLYQKNQKKMQLSEGVKSLILKALEEN